VVTQSTRNYLNLYLQIDIVHLKICIQALIMKIVIGLINLIALIGAIVWWLAAPDWEPAVTSLALFSALLAQVFTNDEIRSRINLIQWFNKGSHNYQTTGNQAITDNKIIQNGGDRSQQIHAENLVMNLGIDEKRAREVFHEMNLQLRKEYTQEALMVADARLSAFENSLMPKMEKVEGALEAFTDPSFQLLLVEAQKIAAATERPVDYDLLSELLVHRFKKGSNRIARAGIGFAIDMVDKVSDDALLGLTVAHAVQSFYPVTGDINKGLDVLNDLFGKIIYGRLPSADEWLDHLDVLNAVRLISFGSLNKIEIYFPKMLSGYVDVGIDKNSENFINAIKILDENDLPRALLVDHDLDDGYVRLPIPSSREINSIVLMKSVAQNGSVHSIPVKLSVKQVEALNSIYSLYSQDGNLKKKNIDSFMIEWNKHKNLKKLREWWDNIPTSFAITSAGKVLAHSNAQRCDNSLPPLD
jgi:hypothetical protein